MEEGNSGSGRRNGGSGRRSGVISVNSGGREKRKGEKGGKIKRSGLQDIYMVEERGMYPLEVFCCPRTVK